MRPESYVAHYYHVNKPLIIRECNSVIVMHGREMINYIIVDVIALLHILYKSVVDSELVLCTHLTPLT